MADVSGSLPYALSKLGVNIRILIPGYPSVLAQLKNLNTIATINNLPNNLSVTLLMGDMPATSANSSVKVIIIQCAALYERNGGPYADAFNKEWPDNALRFGVLSKVAAILSSEQSPIQNWRPDIVHCNDWQTGLTPAYLKLNPTLHNKAVKSIISLHNMAFQGCFPADWVEILGLSQAHFNIEGFEYHGQLSFLKAGIYYADAITTVSSSYAKEIQSSAFGFGLEGLLTIRGSEIKGILNGIETNEWNPEHDPYLIKNYSSTKLAGKKQVKKSLQQLLRLRIDANAPLLGIVSRLTHQKGLDLLLPNVQVLLDAGCQFVLLGSGESSLESAFQDIALKNPTQFSVTIGYNEPLSHQIMAGSDMFIMPSRFEPCGLNQLYGLAYGTPPIVNATGGLADSVIDSNASNIKDRIADGFVMSETTTGGLLSTILRALAIFNGDKKTWQQIQKNGMKKPLSWDKSAREYLAVYQDLLD